MVLKKPALVRRIVFVWMHQQYAFFRNGYIEIKNHACNLLVGNLIEGQEHPSHFVRCIYSYCFGILYYVDYLCLSLVISVVSFSF